MADAEPPAHALCRNSAQRASVLDFLLRACWAGALFLLAGCGAPGDPVPPRPIVAEAVSDLAARQLGESVVLTFHLPQTTLQGAPLEQSPAVEIYRGFLPAGAQPGTAGTSPALVYTIPAALVETYVADGRVHFTDPLKPEDLERHTGEQVVYVVRTRLSKRRASADSNVVFLHIYPVPAPVQDLAASVTETAVELRWTPPTRTSAGAPLEALAGYRIYRAEAEPGAARPGMEATAAASPPKLKSPLELVAVAPSASYRDTQFEVDHTYVYTVRSVAQYASDSVESADSALVVVTPRDTFPPAAPQNLVVIPVAAVPGAPAHLDLSWSISPEPDVAGYHVYRSGPEGGRGERLDPQLLPTPTFRDMSAVPGRQYTYTVTAVDRAGNESLPSSPVSGEVPQTSNSEKAKP